MAPRFDTNTRQEGNRGEKWRQQTSTYRGSGQSRDYFIYKILLKLSCCLGGVQYTEL